MADSSLLDWSTCCRIFRISIVFVIKITSSGRRGRLARRLDHLALRTDPNLQVAAVVAAAAAMPVLPCSGRFWVSVAPGLGPLAGANIFVNPKHLSQPIGGLDLLLRAVPALPGSAVRYL